jgi:hypothetical protein
LGLKGNINTITVTEFHRKIDEIMENPIYKENVLKMRKVFLQKSEELSATILSLKEQVLIL